MRRPTDKQINITCPAEIKTKIDYIADENGRSTNQEILQLIKKHIRKFEDENGEIKL